LPVARRFAQDAGENDVKMRSFWRYTAAALRFCGTSVSFLTLPGRDIEDAAALPPGLFFSMPRAFICIGLNQK
jgi:hypothetical protein